MATLVLQAAGAAVGSYLGGPIGAVIGRTAGAIAGSYIDQQIFGPGDQSTSGPRLETTQALTSREGTPIARVYGRTRISGEVIWATNLYEVQSTETQSQGGKGSGPSTSTTTYSYYANFAIGLCEGEIAKIGRIWADGKLLDNTSYTIRTYTGSPYQSADSLILAKQGSHNAPAYRGLAYIVFENFPVAEFGNRIPQIAVEIIRPIGRLEKHVHAVNMIPGATEFGYDTQPVVEALSEVESRALNVHQSVSDTDFEASLDELIAVCPNLKQIALVVTWFGDDLRAGNCSITPRVETNYRFLTAGEDWYVAGLARENAPLVSTYFGSPAYGGTPSDNSVIRAIQAIKARGIRVCLNPFVMMDIGPDNAKPDPYGQAEQSVFPWRGRITCHPAPGRPDTADATATATAQFANIIGEASVTDVVNGTDRIEHIGLTEWSYRRFILHYMRLAAQAGGVDMFLIGSELRGLTAVRGANDTFPFVEALSQLAYEVKFTLGPNTLVTYGADWSEYFGYQPADGSGDVYFNLDELWSNPSIDAIGIDNYMPLSDWRDDLETEGRSATDPAMLDNMMEAGEGFDWYYASPQDRRAAIRTSITDGLGKPWVFRFKDLKSWWSNYHYDRRAGVEQSNVTSWVPQSKPIIFTEFGSPAVSNGAAQPNVFYDPKSAESAFPYGSNGNRSDQAQASYIEAHQRHWDAGHVYFKQSNNPLSSIYSGRMVDFENSQLWAWDARPFPSFPDLSEVWSDSRNWHTGHWLNGRLGSVRLADLIAELLVENGIIRFDVSQVNGTMDGYLIGDLSSARGALDVLIELHNLSVYEDEDVLFFKSPGRETAQHFEYEELILNGDEPSFQINREQESDVPSAVKLGHISPEIDFQPSQAKAQLTDAKGLRTKTISAPIVANEAVLQPLLDKWLHDRWIGTQSIRFSVPIEHSHITVGDEVTLGSNAPHQRWRVMEIETGESISISARGVERTSDAPTSTPEDRQVAKNNTSVAAPLVAFLDLPEIVSSNSVGGNAIAAVRVPWAGDLAVFASPTSEGFAFQQRLDNSAFIGRLAADFAGSEINGRWDNRSALQLDLFSGSLASASKILTLNGANAMAVQSRNGGWEVLQFQMAEITGPKSWKVTSLLRGQAGTEQEALVGSDQNAMVVLLNSAVQPLQNAPDFRGRPINWAVGPVSKALSDPQYTKQTYTPGYRALLPYSPVHLTARHIDDGDLLLNWKRRDRASSDDWEPFEIPQSEAAELYQIEIASNAGSTLTLFSSSTTLVVSANDLTTAFGGATTTLSITVSQVSAQVGAGPSRAIIHLLTN